MKIAKVPGHNMLKAHNCISFLFFFLTFGAIYGQNKLTLNPQQLLIVNALGEPARLLDEQSLAGDPAAGQGGTPLSRYEPGYSDLYMPAQVIIDLQSEHALSDLWYYDMHGRDSILVSTGTPGAWRRQKTVYTNRFGSWQSIPLVDTARFVRLLFLSNQAQVAEIVFYGRDLSSGRSVPPPPAPARKALPMGDFIGLNGFIDDPINMLANAGGSLREYHRWQWNEGDIDTSYAGYPNNQNAFNPSWVPNWNFDQYYADLQQRGVTVAPVIQGVPPYLLASDDPEVKPLQPAQDATSPYSYFAHADFMFQFAARYGRRAVPDSLLKLRADQPRLSGLGTLRYVENWNEPDKWWRGRAGQFSPFEYAAMCSADYDGHEGRMGPTKGVKNADSTFKFVMGGLVSLDLNYLKAMKLWSDYQRQSGLPADVLNFHHYSNNAADRYQKGSSGLSPEADSLKYKLRKVVAYRNKWLPDKEIWLSEFGYDTNPQSAQSATAIGPYDIYEVQAQWLVRSFLEIAASGIDRAFMYMSRDVYAPNPRRYSSSGLTREKFNQFQPKRSYYYQVTFRKILKHYRFSREMATGDDRVNLYEFKHLTSDSLAYALWCNTSEGLQLPHFKVALSGKSPLRYLQLRDKQLGPSDSLVRLQGDSITVPVSERPVFLKTVALDQVAPEAHPHKQVYAYLDEQGEAHLDAAAVDSASRDNRELVSLKLAQSQYNCSQLPLGKDTAWLINRLYAADHYTTDSASFRVVLVDTLPPVARPQVIEATVNALGEAVVQASQLSGAGFDNCATIRSRRIEDSIFTCSDLLFHAEQQWVSDSSWRRSSWVNQQDASGWPWQASDTLPAAHTFHLPVEQGQPYSYFSVDSVPGSRVLKAGNYLRYFRKTFHLPQRPISEMRLWYTADDNLSIFLNGELIAFENDRIGSASQAAVHAFALRANGQVQDGYEGHTSVGHISTYGWQELLHPGENTLTVGLHNYNNLGGFSLKMSLLFEAVETTFFISDSQGKTAAAPLRVLIRDTAGYCGRISGKKGAGDSTSAQASGWAVYPNPTHQTFQVELPPRPVGEVQLELYHQNGALLRRFHPRQSPESYSLKGLPAGVYFLHLHGYRRNYWQKVVKI